MAQPYGPVGMTEPAYDYEAGSHIHTAYDHSWSQNPDSLSMAMPTHYAGSHQVHDQLHDKPDGGYHYATPWTQHYQPEPKHMTLNPSTHQQQQQQSTLAGLNTAPASQSPYHHAHGQQPSYYSPIHHNAMLPPTSYSQKSFPQSLGAPKRSHSKPPSRNPLSAKSGSASPSKSPQPSLTSSSSTESASSTNSELATPPNSTTPPGPAPLGGGPPQPARSSSQAHSIKQVKGSSVMDDFEAEKSGVASSSLKSQSDREAYLARNRLAASRSRQRKKQRVGELESRAQTYSEANQMLQQQALALHAEFLQLRALLTHVLESTPPESMSAELHQYLERERAGQAGVAYIQSIAGNSLVTDYAL
ncbi:hypothetical protein OIO90_000081 [Microbotryomycetes sp. JL221]|nr:hypothetical protein OIO90_000081 [Microbotryomycetes sp. JL221]